MAPTNSHDLSATFTIRPGDRVHVSIQSLLPEELDGDPADVPSVGDLDHRADETRAWWRKWAARVTFDGRDGPDVRRSAIVLKALTNARTGAVAAAVTTSLPECPGGERNWDYRYSWIRDSNFTVWSLAEVGFDAEAEGFRRFIERSSAANGESLQIMYGLGGERRLTEFELDLDGYRNARPVRIGNGAAGQEQHDVYGELLNLAWFWYRRGHSPDDDYWRFLASVVDLAAERWSEPDAGMWEMRGEPRHFVQSKAMCWVALDRGLRLAEECALRAPVRHWRKVRAEVRDAIDAHGYDSERGVFVQAFGGKHLDAALLRLPFAGFVGFTDDRMVRTTEAIRNELDEGGLLRRYLNDDGLPGREGAFLACSFWLVECLAWSESIGRSPRQSSTAPSQRATISACSRKSSMSHTAQCSEISRRGSPIFRTSRLRLPLTRPIRRRATQLTRHCVTSEPSARFFPFKGCPRCNGCAPTETGRRGGSGMFVGVPGGSFRQMTAHCVHRHASHESPGGCHLGPAG